MCPTPKSFRMKCVNAAGGGVVQGREEGKEKNKRWQNRIGDIEYCPFSLALLLRWQKNAS